MDIQFQLGQLQLSIQIMFQPRPDRDNNKEELPMRKTFQRLENETNTEGTGLDKYARKTNPNVSLPKPNNNEVRKQVAPAGKPVGPMQKSSINRYYRNEAAPRTQFKHYLSDINNVFYEERQSKRLISLYDQITKVTLIIWVFLFIVFLAMLFIKPYDGVCPSNAQCGVFVHCFKGFRYDAQSNQCVLSEDLYNQIESVCTDRIIKARQEWAHQQCNDQPQTVPQIRLDQILSGVSNSQLKWQLMQRLETFLENQQNQQSFYFSYRRASKIITPNLKKYSFFCKIKFMTKTANFKLGLPIFLLISLAVIFVFLEIRKRIIAKNIYDVLRKKTMAEKLVNISYTKPDMQKQYGAIDEKMWELIDEYRSKDKDIGYLQDDFLYWKML